MPDLNFNAENSSLSVVQFQRRPMLGQVSIERLFAEVRRHFPPNLQCRVHVCPRPSRGLIGRVANVRDATRHQGQVNHITGDVHYLTMGLPGRRTLLTICDCASFERLRGLKREIFRWFWYSLPVRQAALISVISEATRRELFREVKCDPAKVRIVPCCVPGEFVRHDRPFNSRQPVILQVGTGGNKNLIRVVEALAGIKCHLKIIGRLSPDQRAALERFRVEFSNIERATDAEMVQAYQACDLVVFASTYEGFGMPILEANTTGRPVVTSDLLSMPEVAGGAACLVNPLEVASIRHGLSRVINEAGYREYLVTSGFENALRFQASAIAAKYAALYEELREYDQE